jgi:hypothetical protein
MPPLRRVVLDVLKPHEPSLVEYARRAAALDGVDGATARLVETDREVQTVLLAVEGSEVPLDRLEGTVTDLGGAVHSVDLAACGERVVDAGTGTGSPSLPRE